MLNHAPCPSQTASRLSTRAAMHRDSIIASRAPSAQHKRPCTTASCACYGHMAILHVPRILIHATPFNRTRSHHSTATNPKQSCNTDTSNACKNAQQSHNPINPIQAADMWQRVLLSCLLPEQSVSTAVEQQNSNPKRPPANPTCGCCVC